MFSLFVHIFTFSPGLRPFSGVLILRGPYSKIPARLLANQEAGFSRITNPRGNKNYTYAFPMSKCPSDLHKKGYTMHKAIDQIEIQIMKRRYYHYSLINRFLVSDE